MHALFSALGDMLDLLFIFSVSVIECMITVLSEIDATC